MTAADYTPFVERMINRYEGGYGWDRADSGGPTKFGITCYDLAEHRHERMDSMARWASLVRAMTITEADVIYQTKYAKQCCFNELLSGTDCVVFDFGVNSGSSRAIKYAQTVVGVGIDGVLGPTTLNAINEHDPRDFINRLCNVRLNFLRGLRIWSNFGRGWSARVFDLRKYSLALIPVVHTGLMMKVKKPKLFEEKENRIPKSFAKAYHPDDLAELKRQHQQ
jgi:lysozyme family protein